MLWEIYRALSTETDKRQQNLINELLLYSLEEKKISLPKFGRRYVILVALTIKYVPFFYKLVYKAVSFNSRNSVQHRYLPNSRYNI